MLQIHSGSSASNCQGTTRRTAIKTGLLGLSGLTLADLLRMRADGSATNTGKSVILVWLDGGPSQLESYDPKPEAPREYRGPFGAMSTNVPGMFISELLQSEAKHADKMAFVRSVHHNTGDHFAGAHWMLTGRFGSTSIDLPQKYPSVGSYISKIKGPKQPGLPAYVGLPAAHAVYIYPGYQGAAYLGSAYNPFDVDKAYSYLSHASANPTRKPQCLESLTTPELDRTGHRASLLTSLDKLERKVDASRMMDSMDKYQQSAMSMILSGRAKEAFNIEHEDPKLIDKYGDNPWGRYTLMARRAVEAGVTFVTVDMPHWDNHSDVEKAHANNFRAMDKAVGALIDDLSVRNLLDDTLVVVMGEFGRTPRINTGQPGIPIPGRDHWGDAISVMLAGGGIKGGQVIGATNSKAEFPVDRPLKPGHILATIYHQLGIDYTQTFPDHAGRPIPMLAEGEAIRELV
ncbi:MAG: DUF1501 domain-containing protein [Planctomycetaceae bacterium]|nr:DUF1501 domain-containing protein [Planctomycetaceae bacterium]